MDTADGTKKTLAEWGRFFYSLSLAWFSLARVRLRIYAFMIVIMSPVEKYFACLDARTLPASVPFVPS